MAGCSNCFFGGKKVGWKGDPKSDLVIIGEAPRPLDMAKGVPFTGDVGKLLQNVLDRPENQIEGDIYYNNALNCLPRQKDPKKLATACTACNSRLIKELQEYPRKMIITLGNGAAWSLTGDYNIKITKERGKIFESPLAEKGIMVTVHPAYLLRGGGNVLQFRNDITKAIDIYKGTEKKSAAKKNKKCKFKEPTYTVLNTLEDVQKLAERLKRSPNLLIGADAETSGFDPRVDYLLCLGLALSDDHTYIIPPHLIIPELFDNECIWCWQNGKFDASFLRAEGPREPNELDKCKYHTGKLDAPNCSKAKVMEDTMLMSYTLNEMGGIHDLEQLGTDWLGTPNYKDMLDAHRSSTKTSYAEIPVDVLYKYLAIDCTLTLQLCKVIRPKVKEDKHLEKLYTKILLPGSEYLSCIEKNGFLVDLKKIAENDTRLTAITDEHENEINRISNELIGEDTNPRSWQQLQNLLYRHLKLGPVSQGTGIKILEKLPKHPAVVALMKYRKDFKLLSTYVRPIAKKISIDGNLHSTYLLHGTTTGRLASRKPNMQNIPRDKHIKGQFIAPPGYIILEVDLSQAELRSLACLSRDPFMVEIYSSDHLSLHKEVALDLFGEDYNAYQYIRAKAVNFGIVYGREAKSFMDEFEITQAEAQSWIDGWFARFPEAHKFIERCRNAPVRGETMLTHFGRKRRFNLVSPDKIKNIQNEAANFPHQSPTSDVTLLTGIELEQPLRTQYDCRIVNTVHDSLVTIMPNDLKLARQAATLIKDTMERIPVDWGMDVVPFKADAEVGFRWGACKDLDKIKGDTLKADFLIN